MAGLNANQVRDASQPNCGWADLCARCSNRLAWESAYAYPCKLMQWFDPHHPVFGNMTGPDLVRFQNGREECPDFAPINMAISELSYKSQ